MSKKPVLRSLSVLEPHLPVGLAFGVVLVVYFPLTRMYFIADDFSNMLTILDRGTLEFILQPFGGHMLMVRNAAYWLHFHLFGFQPDGYGWVALLTHLLNTWLFYRIGCRFTGERALGALGALVWGASPLLEGALAWYSVYGQVLSGTALLLVLDRMAHWEESRGPVTGREVAIWGALLLAGAASFGVGIAIAIAFPAVAFLLLPRAARGRTAMVLVGCVPVVVVATYGASRYLFGLLYPMPFSEEVMHGVAFSAVTPILKLFGHFMAVGAIWLVEGFWFDAQSYPASGLGALGAFVLLVVAGAVCTDEAGRRHLAAFLFLAAAVYGFIALGRANVYVMFGVPLEQAAKTLRYHYAASIPLAMVVPLALGAVLARIRWPASANAVPFAVSAAIIAVAHATSGWHLDGHWPARAYVERVLATIDATVETVPAGQELLIQNRPLPPLLTGPVIGYGDIPGWAGLFALAEPDNEVRGRRVRFVQSVEQQRTYRPKTPHVASFFAPAGGISAR